MKTKKARLKRGKIKPVLFGHHYKTRKTSGEFVRLYEYRAVGTTKIGKFKAGRVPTRVLRYRWVCIAVGTKALHGIAQALNMLPHI